MNRTNDTSADEAVAAGRVGRFLWLSDIHLDPYYGTDDAAGHENCHELTPQSDENDEFLLYGQLGCDSPARLMRHLLEAVAALKSTLDFVILTGDLCRHQNDAFKDPMRETQAILSNVTDLIQSTLGKNTSIVPALGNNDVTPDYFLDVEHPSEMLEMTTQGLNDILETELERSTFRRGGYLARNVTNHVTVLSLNTILYSTAHNPDKSHLQDPLDQFTWLHAQLSSAQATDRKVYVVGHIPPAIGSYRHHQLWHESYARRYFEILDEFYTVLAGEFFGHLHSDEFRLIHLDENLDGARQRSSDQWPLWLAPSVTPIYGSNPSFRVVSYDPLNGDLLDYHTYYLRIFGDSDMNVTNFTSWVLAPSFRESFRLPDMSLASLRGLVHDLNRSVDDNDTLNSLSTEEGTVNGNPLWRALLSRQHVYAENGTGSCRDSECRREWICTLTTFNREQFGACNVRRDASISVNTTWQTSVGRIVVFVVAGLGGILFVWWLQRYLRRRHYIQHIDVENAHEEIGDHSSSKDAGKLGDTSYDAIELQGEREEHRPRLLRAIS